jgi:hypothetical protein
MELRTFEFLNYFPILLLLHLPNYPPRWSMIMSLSPPHNFSSLFSLTCIVL